MKIIFVVSALHGGGAERVITTLANAFERCGDKVKILMIAGTERVYNLEKNIEVISIERASCGNLLIQLRRIFRLRNYLKRCSDYEIVSFSTTTNMFTILASLGLGNKVIVSERNDPNQYAHKKIRDFIYKFNRRFVFQTEEARNCFSQNIRDNSVVIPNPLRKDIPRAFEEGMREKKIAAVGRLEPQKNYILLLYAFAGFHRRYPEYELHIFGQGSFEIQLKNIAKMLGVEEQVFFEGFCDNVLETIRTYSMYVLSSDYEGIPNSLIEAMALGLPCISTNCPIGGPAMCIMEGVNGLLVPIQNRTLLQEAMERIASDRSLAFRMGKNAEEVRNIFAEEKVTEMWREYIRT